MLMQKFKWNHIFLFLICFTFSKTILAQSGFPIALNEIQVTNTTNQNLDNYFEPSDWVEIKNNFTSTVSLSGYYLSNDRTNLRKWSFPSTFTMGIGQFSIVWLSGRNETKIVNGLHHMHTNFKIDQCKKQWLILTGPNGVIRDSIYIQRTKENHTRGRLLDDWTNIGVQAWRVYTAPTFSATNNLPGYIDYCPQPNFTEPPGIGAVTSPTFELYTLFSGAAIDTSCYNVYYTTDGSYPTPSNGNIYIDAATSLIFPPISTTMFRAATYPKSTATVVPAVPPTWCESNYLPSFVQTNTYFCEPGHLLTDFSQKFGILSIAMEPTDNWFLVGTPATTAHVEYFDMNSNDPKKSVLEGYAQITKPVNESWLTAQKGFNVDIDDRRGYGCNFEGNIFNVPELGTSTRTLFPTLQVYGGDLEAEAGPATNTTNPSQGTALRDVFIQSLAVKYNMNVNPLHFKPIAVFINAKYVGTYNLKEVYDKFYEEYYNKQTQTDKTTMLFYHNNEGIVQTHSTTNNWYGAPQNDIYRFLTVYPFNSTAITPPNANYTILKNRLDIPNFIDWTITNSFTQNSNIYGYNIAMARGSNSLTSGGKWHHYLWNMPATFQYTFVAQNTYVYNNPISNPCAISQPSYALSPNAYNGQGIMFYNLMNKFGGNAEFRRDYLMRYQDLLNGPFNCNNLDKHWTDIYNLYKPEMVKHEGGPNALPFPGPFIQAPDTWDTCMSALKRALQQRCNFMEDAFSKNVNCNGLVGPYDLTVDVFPVGAGKVKLNSMILPNYIWSGKYFKGPLAFKAYPADSTFVFDHWELQNHVETNNRPLSLDSIGINFANTAGDKVVAVFTDRTKDSGVPTGFSPNGDGNNDVFGILGSGKYSNEFEMRIWNRWGQEVFRSTDPTVGWDGNYNGSQAQTGVYAYYITYKNIFNEVKNIKGNVTLVR